MHKKSAISNVESEKGLVETEMDNAQKSQEKLVPMSLPFL